tara:strand:- start:219 stop:464 length:246 start_codon:yes stop_codon:yes gene_type:complete
MNNPILASLKAKRGLQTDIGFGSKPPRGARNANASAASHHELRTADKPENYLGPGYYECKGGFDPPGASYNQAAKGSQMLP